MSMILCLVCCLLGWLQGRQGKAWGRRALAERAGGQPAAPRAPLAVVRCQGAMVGGSAARVPVLSPDTCGKGRDGLISWWAGSSGLQTKAGEATLKSTKSCCVTHPPEHGGLPSFVAGGAVGPAQRRQGKPSRIPLLFTTYATQDGVTSQAERAEQSMSEGRPMWWPLCCGVNPRSQGHWRLDRSTGD